MIKDITDARRIKEQLEAVRAPFFKSCKTIAKYTMPYLGNWGTSKQDGDLIDHKTLLDSDVENDINDLAAGMQNGLTSPSKRWFELTVDYPRFWIPAAVKQWLEDTCTLIELIMQKSNLYRVLHALYIETAIFGTGCFFIKEDAEKIIDCEFLTFGDYYLGLGKNGKVQIFARDIVKTVLELVEEFGLENLPETVKAAYNGKLYTQEFTITHLVCPNENYIPGSKISKHFEYASFYFMDGKEEFVSVGGYDYWPVISPRWFTKNKSMTYGKGPGWFALGDLKQIQRMERKKMSSTGKKEDPPLLVSSSVTGPIDVSEGAVNVVNGQVEGAVRTMYQVDIDNEKLTRDQAVKKESVRKKFFADVFHLFTPENVGKMLAYEINRREVERLSKIGPILNVLNDEALIPIIETIFYLLNKHNIVDPAPQELQGRNLNINFVSIVAMAQKASSLNTYEDAVRRLFELAQARPEVLDNIDADKYARLIGEKIGAGLIFKDEEVVSQEREQRAQAAQMQQQAANAQALLQGAKTASEIPLGNDSALDTVLENTGMAA
ncbi:hypothetical protein AAIR98_001440 [Elusimicrobium simillimum]|uniref:portal protein n=1 Tax=Elusimicrobium simillimum TaxID=3143438 RepID=UPI003C6F9BCB